MKMSYGWLKEFLPALPPPAETALRLSGAGLGVASLRPFTAAWDGIVVGEVLEAGRHPNADRLSVCVVEAGGETYRVVCGAPNVRAGMKAPFAMVGARLPGGKTIGAATIRGVASQGMLCSAVELGLGSDAGGLMELPADALTGEPFAPNPDDWMLDLEVTPNRGDCLSALGAARQLGAVLGVPAKLPWPAPEFPDAGSAGWEVAIEDQSGCGVYTARLLRDVKVAPSPEWLQRRLLACGMRPINNVVDVTNFVMLELGQPLHAFDTAKLTSTRVVARRAKPGESITTLDGVDRKLGLEVLVIADRAGPQAVAGVMGGASSEITSDTVEVLLESAWFEPGRVRRGARLTGAATESSYRFERGVDPAGVFRASDRAAALLVEVAGATVASGRREARREVPLQPVIEVTTAEISSLLGMEIPLPKLKEYATRLGCLVTEKGAALRVTPPTWRLDLTLPADIAEEVAIVHGYDRIPATMPALTTRLLPVATADHVARRIQNTLRAAGFSEAQTWSFTSAAELKRTGWSGAAAGVPIQNPLTEDHALLRPTLLAGLLRSAAYNLAREAPGVRLFEMNDVFAPAGTPEAGGVEESPRLALVAAGRVAQRLDQPERVLGLQDLQGALDAAAAASGVVWSWTPAEAPSFANGQCAVAQVSGRTVGTAGVLAPGVADALDLPAGACAAEFDLAALVAASVLDRPVTAPPRQPGVRRDLAVVAAEAVTVARMREVLMTAGAPLLESAELFDIYTGKQVVTGSRSLAWRLVFRAADRTLTEAEVEVVVVRITAALAAECQAAIRAV